MYNQDLIEFDMPRYQPVYTQIWKDGNFSKLTVEGKLLFIYLATNDSINNSGIYEIPLKTISNETGLSLKTVSQLLGNGSLKNISYDFESECVFVHNRRKYSSGGNPKAVQKGIEREYQLLPNCSLWVTFNSLYPSILKDTFNPYATVKEPFNTLTLSNSIKDINNKNTETEKKEFKQNKLTVPVLAYLNSKLGTKYKPGSKETNGHINARAEEGYCLEDFKTVIDYKVCQWGNDPNMQEYLRPKTLFSPKFEGYLNAAIVNKNKEKELEEADDLF